MNSFGQGYVPGYAALQMFPLYDPRSVRDSRQRFKREAIPELERANSFYCPSGQWPARGWILMARRDLNLLNFYSTTLRLDVGNPTAPGNVGSFNNLSIVQARCVSAGLASDPAAIYLVEITDGRGLLHNKWFQFPTVTAYNIRAPGYPSTDRGGTFYPLSMNGGTTWTWSAMVQNLWEQMGTYLGPWPGLPAGAAPDGTPEGFWFTGVSAWHALCQVLDHLGLVVACDLTSTTPYTIVQRGVLDLVLASKQVIYRRSLEDDLEWLDVGAGRVPLTVVVLFRRRNDVYGTEETTPYRNDGMAQQWAMYATYPVSVNATDIGLTQFINATGTHYIWSDYTVRFDHNSAVYAADATYATTLARQRAAQYYASIDPSNYLQQTYAGPLPFVTGSRVDGVCWYQDYRIDSSGGWRTQVVYGPDPPWTGIWEDIVAR